MFDANFQGSIKVGNWDFRNDTGPTRQLFLADHVLKNEAVLSRLPYKNIRFTECDFAGGFEIRMVFKDCEFKLCDFGLSAWKNAKFTSCIFEKCSFTQATFTKCEFRECEWRQIGLSGNETDLPDSEITNPMAFLEAAYTNTNMELLGQHGKTTSEQKSKFERSRSTVARQIFINASKSGEERAYYEVLHAHIKYSIKARRSEALIRAKSSSLFPAIFLYVQALICDLEWLIIRTTGNINSWGASIARPFLLGIVCIVLFALVYWVCGIRTSVLSALMTSLDITLLVGYGKHATLGLPILEEGVFALNMLIGIAWYAVFAATVVNRVSRVR
jgi:hypothetical protein